MKLFTSIPIILLLLFLNPVVGLGQNAEKEKVYDNFPQLRFDLSKPSKITIPNKLKHGEFYQIHINGINQNLYNIIVDKRDTLSSTPLKFPTLGTVDLSSVSSLLGNFNSYSAVVSDAVVEGKKVASELKVQSLDLGIESDQALLMLEKQQECISNCMASIASPKKKAKKDNHEIEKHLASLETTIEGYLGVLSSLNTDIDKLQMEFSKYRMEKELNPITSGSFTDFQSKVAQFEILRQTVDQLEQNVRQSISSHQSFIADKKPFLEKNKDSKWKKDLEKVTSALNEIKNKVGNFKTSVTTENIEKMFRSVIHLYTKDSFTSLPIQYHGETVEIEINLQPKDPSSGLQAIPLRTVRLPGKNWYWTVGSSLYYSGLFDERLSVQDTFINDSTTKFQLLGEHRFSGEIGVAATIMGGWKFGNSVGLHGMVGTGLSLGKETRPRMLLGTGVTLGNKHSFVLDVGTIVGYVDQISSNAIIEKKLYKEEPQPLVTQLKWSYFVSVGYAYRF